MNTTMLFQALYADTATGGPALDADVAMDVARQCAALVAGQAAIAAEITATNAAAQTHPDTAPAGSAPAIEHRRVDEITRRLRDRGAEQACIEADAALLRAAGLAA